MFVKLSQIIQKFQRIFYKATTHTYKMQKINGTSCVLQSVFLQKSKDMIDLQHPLIKDLKVKCIQATKDGKYNEFYTITKVDKIENIVKL